jgi:hypothetical protein
VLLSCLKHAHDRRRLPQEHRLPTGRLGETQEVHHAGGIDALTERGSDNGLSLRYRSLLQTVKTRGFQDEHRGAVHRHPRFGRARLSAQPAVGLDDPQYVIHPVRLDAG